MSRNLISDSASDSEERKWGFVRNNSEVQINARRTRMSIYKRCHTEKFEAPSLNYSFVPNCNGANCK